MPAGLKRAVRLHQLAGAMALQTKLFGHLYHKRLTGFPVSKIMLLEKVESSPFGIENPLQTGAAMALNTIGMMF